MAHLVQTGKMRRAFGKGATGATGNDARRGEAPVGLPPPQSQPRSCVSLCRQTLWEAALYPTTPPPRQPTTPQTAATRARASYSIAAGLLKGPSPVLGSEVGRTGVTVGAAVILGPGGEIGGVNAPAQVAGLRGGRDPRNGNLSVRDVADAHVGRCAGMDRRGQQRPAGAEGSQSPGGPPGETNGRERRKRHGMSAQEDRGSDRELPRLAVPREFFA